MIKLVNVDKFYNKSKSNELHVIDNLSLELPASGFVTILGRSGSGKSTLLNIIGGLDKANGKINYDDLTIENYSFDYSEKYDAGYILKDIDKTEITLTQGRMPASENEIVVSKNLNNIGKTINGLTVVGLCETENDYIIYSLNSTRVKYYFDICAAEYNPTISFKVSDYNEAKEHFENEDLLVLTPYNLAYSFEKNMLTASRITSIIFIVVLFIFSVIYIYFSIRSKLINQIKTIGVYRSIGATRWQISRVYLASTIIQTTLTAALGYVIVCIVYSYIAINLERLGGDILFNTKFVPLYLFFGLVILYIVHMIFGLLPVWSLMRKTPAEINSKYDI